MKETQYLFDVIKFNDQNLIPAIVQDYKNNKILMMAWMNKESIEITMATKLAHYFSRNRQKLWKKGEISGQIQEVKEILIDCDYDSLLLKVKQHGVACHTGRANCFFNQINIDDMRGKITINQEIIIPSKELYNKE